jgi:hypothetical protein
MVDLPYFYLFLDRTLPWWHTKWANMINGTGKELQLMSTSIE